MIYSLRLWAKFIFIIIAAESVCVRKLGEYHNTLYEFTAILLAVVKWFAAGGRVTWQFANQS